MLIAMCGLPGSGKSTVADDLGRRRGWPVLSVDPVEAAIRRAGVAPGQPVGLAAYVVVEAVAEHLLTLGQTVVVDAVNDVPEARGQWLALAERRGVPLQFVEVVCSDPEVHRRRLESRRRGLVGMDEPSWDSLVPRRAELQRWTGERITVDSLGDHEDLVTGVLERLARAGV
jgi:predicted kinase